MKPFRVLIGLLLLGLLSAPLAGVPATHVRGAALAAADGWEASRIDDASLIYTLEPQAAAVDAAGRLHVAFGGDHLYYALCGAGSPGSCTVETVDPQDFVGLNTSLALDTAGRPHIAYFAGSDMPYCDDEQVKYAFWDGSAWTVEQVTQECVGQHLSLALGSSGKAAISFFDDLWDTLQFAEREGPDLWNSFTLDASLDAVGQYSVLEFDSQGVLHVGYLGGDYSYTGIWHQERSDGSWSGPQEVDSSGYFTRLDMAVGGSGTPHFAYHDQSTSTLRYATLGSGGWTSETLFDMAYNQSPAVVVAANGEPQIAFARSSDIGYSVHTVAGWSTPEAVSASGGNPLALALDPQDDRPNLVFLQAGTLQFTRRGAAWPAAHPIASGGDTGLYVDMQTDPSGGQHVAYFDRQRGALRYGYSDGAGWSLETVLNNVDLVGLSLALDDSNRPHIAFADYQGYQHTVLRYLAWDGLDWQERPAISSDGGSPSLALDSSNTPHVAFTEVVNYQDQVTIVTWNGAGWDSRLVAAAGRLPSLLLNDSGVAHISFISGDYPNMTLNLAVQNGPAAWNISPIDSAQNLNTNRLAMDSGGWLHAVYQVEDPSRDWIPRYARQTTGGWLYENIYPEYGEIEPRQMDLLVEANGAVHVSSQYDHNLYYSLRSSTGWTTTFWVDINEVFELDLDTGEFSALGLDSRGEPLIAYYGELDLKLLRVADPLQTYYLPMARAR